MTSLAGQLQSLALKGLTFDVELHKRPSFLFDSQKAASIDREEAHAIGLNGYEGLCSIDESFELFSSLFDEAAKHTERSMLTKKENASLDKKIGKFLRHSAPYFLLRSTHKCIEWLVYRFRVHYFNPDILLFAFLPYHTSKLYTRLLQLFEPSFLEKRWPILNTDVTPSKSVVLEQCLNDRSFFAKICENLSKSLKECDQTSPKTTGILRPAVNVFVIYAMEIIQNLKKGKNEFLSTLMPYIVIGIKSKALEYKAASLMLVTLLSSKMTLAEEVTIPLLDLISNAYKEDNLSKECLLAIINLCQAQENINNLTDKSVYNLVESEDFLKHIGECGRFDIDKFVMLLCLKLVELHRGITRQIYDPELLLKLVHSFQLSTVAQESLVTSLMQGLAVETSDTHLLKALLAMHKKYPHTVMEVVSKTGKMESSENVQKIVDALLIAGEAQEFSDCSFLSFALDLDNLEEDSRSSAVITLMRMLKMQPEISKSDFVRQSVKSRLLVDSSPTVAMLILELVGNYPDTFFYDMESAGNTLLCLMLKNRGKLDWTEVSEAALEMLLGDLFSSCSEELSDLLAFLLRDMIFNEACVQDKDVVKRLNKDGSFMTKINWILTENWKNGPVSILEAVSQAFTKDPKLYLKFKRASQKISELLMQTDGVGIELRNEKLPFHYLVNLAFLKSVFSYNATSSCITMLWSAVVSIFEEAIVDLQYLLLQTTDVSSRKTSADSGEKADFVTCLLKLSREYYDDSPTTETRTAVLFKMLADSYAILRKAYKNPITTEFYNTVNRETSSAMENLKREKDIGSDGVYLIIKKLMLDFFVQALPFVNERSNDITKTEFQSNMRTFLKIFFCNAEEIIQHLSGYWSIIMSDPVQEKIGISALNISKAIISSKKDIKIQDLLSPESPFIPSLLVALNHDNVEMRRRAIDSLTALLSVGSSFKQNFHTLAKYVNDNNGVIIDDSGMIEVILSKFFAQKSKTDNTISKTTMLDLMFHHISKDNSPTSIKAALLHVLKKSVSVDLTIAISSDLSSVLERWSSNEVVDKSEALFMKEGIARITPEALSQTTVKAVFWKALECDNLITSDVSYEVSPQTICLRSITKDFYSMLDDRMKKNIIGKLLDIVTSCRTSADNVAKVFKNITLDATHVKAEFESMLDSTDNEEPTPKKARLSENDQNDIWRKIVALLEFLQEKKKITNIKDLFPLLFRILEISLDDRNSLTIPENAEYIKQLVLTLVLHLLQRLKKQQCQNLNDVVSNVCKIESVVHCVRSSTSTQTQHHALLLLTEMAVFIPERVLHNIMAIFTFMGSHLLRQDDSYSLQVISKTMKVVIPALTKVDSKLSKKTEWPALRIAHAFIDSLPHIPPHRRILIIHELLGTIGGKDYLWVVVLLLADLSVRKPIINEDADSICEENISGDDPIEKICCSVSDLEDLTVQIDSIVKCMEYILTLPFRIKGQIQQRGTILPVIELQSLNTAQLHKFYKAALTFLTKIIVHNQQDLLSHLKKRHSVDIVDEDGTLILALQTLYERVLQLISKITSDIAKDQEFMRFSKEIISKCYDVMWSINAVLPFEVSVSIFNVLLNKEDTFIKCKALELLSKHFSLRRDALNDSEVCSIADICAEISGMIRNTIESTEIPDQEHCVLRYSALATLKIAIRNFGKIKPESFTKSLDNLCHIVVHLEHMVHTQVSAAVFLALAEMCSCLKAYCIPYLNKFVPQLLKMVCQLKTLHNDSLLFACVTLIHRLLESLVEFSSSYLEQIIEKISALLLLEKYSFDAEAEIDSSTLSYRIGARLKVIVNIIGTKVPSRVLLLVFTKSLDNDSEKSISRIRPLCMLVLKHVQTLKRDDVVQTLPSLAPMLYKLLEFQFENIEDLTTDIAVTAMLKLPENAFRSFFFGLSDWALTNETDEHLPVYFRLMLKLSQKMKGLFSLFCGIVIENAATTLKGEYIDKNHALLRLICSTLTSVFSNDNSNILTKERFDMLSEPLVAHFDKAGDLNESSDLICMVREDLVPLLGEIALSVADDTCQKQLNYKILLKLRHSKPSVRYLSLKAIEEVGSRMGSEYSMLLPETIPFLSELMEDDNDMVEAECHSVIRSLEKALGEPLQKYFDQ